MTKLPSEDFLIPAEMQSTHHINSIRFSKPTRPTIANISIRCIKNTICVLNQTSLIYIYSGIKCNLKSTTVWINKSSHNFKTLFWSCPSNYNYLYLPSLSASDFHLNSAYSKFFSLAVPALTVLIYNL